LVFVLLLGCSVLFCWAFLSFEHCDFSMFFKTEAALYPSSAATNFLFRAPTSFFYNTLFLLSIEGPLSLFLRVSSRPVALPAFRSGYAEGRAPVKIGRRPVTNKTPLSSIAPRFSLHLVTHWAPHAPNTLSNESPGTKTCGPSPPALYVKRAESDFSCSPSFFLLCIPMKSAFLTSTSSEGVRRQVSSQRDNSLKRTLLRTSKPPICSFCPSPSHSLPLVFPFSLGDIAEPGRTRVRSVARMPHLSSPPLPLSFCAIPGPPAYRIAPQRAA